MDEQNQQPSPPAGPPPPAPQPILAPPTPPPVADWPPVPPAAGPASPGSVVRLWPAGTIGVLSFLFGFPGGLALAAGNWHRLGQRPLAYAHLVAIAIAMLVILVLPDAATGVAGAANVLVAIYVYVRMRGALDNARRRGLVVEPGGVPAGLATIAGGWALSIGALFVLSLVVAIAQTGDDRVADATWASPSPAASGAIEGAAPTATDAGTGQDPPSEGDRCPAMEAIPHQAPDLEARLPSRVAGRGLATWSVAGWCWLRMALGDDALDELGPLVEQEGVDVANLRYAVAGRADTTTAPPFLVFAASRPASPSEVELAQALLLGGAGHQAVAIDLADLELRWVGDRMTFVGTEDMVAQSEHQRGKPWFYQTADTMFLVVTDDDTWAKDAIGQLPCCWEGN